MNVEVQTRNVELTPALRTLIEGRLALLERRYPELRRIHMTLRRDGHHLQGSEEVDVLAVCAGATLRAAKHKASVRDALHAALDAVERQLAEHHEYRRACRPSMP